MKKILAVLIAISMVATMAFAADFAFSVKTSGNVAAWSLGDNAVELISRDPDDSEAKLEASVDGKAGVSVNLKAEDNGTVALDDGSIWIKPVDGVKLTFNGANFSVAASTFNTDGWQAWYGVVAGKADGFTVEYTGIENLTVKAGIQKSVMTNGGFPGTAAYVSYKVADALTVEADINNDVDFAVAASGKVDPVSYCVVFQDVADAMLVHEKVSATIDVAPVTIALAEDVKLTGLDSTLAAAANASVKASYDIASCEAKVSVADLMAKKMALTTTITPEVKKTGKIGDADWELGAKAVVTIPSAGDVTVDVTVPYSVKIAF